VPGQEYLAGLYMQPLALDLFGPRIDAKLRALDAAGLAWHDSDVFHWAISHADRFDEFHAFLAALRGRRTIVVGPPHVRGATADLFGAAAFVEVPAVDCYPAATDVLCRTLDLAVPMRDHPVVLLSASMPAELLAVALHDAKSADRPMTVLDMGSVWDPYAGVFSRSYMRQLHAAGWAWPR
jgi:hypothetical protein